MDGRAVADRVDHVPAAVVGEGDVAPADATVGVVQLYVVRHRPAVDDDGVLERRIPARLVVEDEADPVGHLDGQRDPGVVHVGHGHPRRDQGRDGDELRPRPVGEIVHVPDAGVGRRP